MAIFQTFKPHFLRFSAKALTQESVPIICTYCNVGLRRLSSGVPGADSEAWQIHSYGGVGELQLTSVRTPAIMKPDQVLVQVHAASLNPMDAAMLGGYGASALNILRQAEDCSSKNTPEFPLTLGRDFAGVVAAKGQKVEDLKVGDQVWGALSPHLQGTHARHVLVPGACVVKKPDNLKMAEAASVVYAAMTAWSALQVTGGLAVLGAEGRNVLVLGGGGGVGTQAVQLLNAWGSVVTATCTSDAVPLLQSLGVPNIVDYTQPGLQDRLAQSGKFDVILDCAGLGMDGSTEYLTHLSDNPLSKFITLKSPLLREMDGKGVVAGALSSLASLVQANLRPGLLPRLAPVRWGFFMPLPPALREITLLASRGKITPCIDATFNFTDAPAAFKKLQSGHARGKIVLNLDSSSA